MATSLPQIVLFRFLQGVGGAALVPLSQAVLFDINPPKDFGRAMSIWGIGVTMGPILGPALGGWLTDNYSWRWVFYINLPIGVLAFAGLFFTMPESRNAQSSRFDFFGFASLSLAIAALQMMLDRGPVAGLVLLARDRHRGAGVRHLPSMFFWSIRFTHPKPFLNPHLFQDRNFVASNIFIFVVGVVLFATLALLPPMLQNQMQYPVVLTGLVTAPRGVGTLIGMFLVGRLVTRFDARAIIAVGLALTAYSLWQMTHFSLLMDTWPVIISGIIQGFGVGLVWVPLSTVAFTTLPAHLRNEGTALLQPAAQCRQLDRHFGGDVPAHPEHPAAACLAGAEHITPYNIGSNSRRRRSCQSRQPARPSGLERR